MSVSSAPQTVVRFGVFEADFRGGELRKNGVRVKIQDLPFRTLKLLLSRPNEVVAREEFRRALWPEDVFVDFDRAISSAIKRLRDALGDPADNPIFIETVDRRGYRWIAPAYAPEAASAPPVVSLAGEEDVTHPHSSSAWKLAYVIPVLTLLFVAWSFRPGFHSAKAGVIGQRSFSPAWAIVHPANQDAKDDYLQGRYYWNKRTPDDLRKAVDYFTQAIVHDPAYSDAYVGLADSYNLLREYTVMPGSEAFPRALAAAQKAVELDSQSSQAHASVAFALFWGNRDSAAADREFRRAVELDPKNATAHHWYATCLATVHRYSDALAEIDRAQALDPSSKSIVADKGSILAQVGRREEAVRLLQQLENTEPGFVSPHRYLRMIYRDAADYPNYLAELKKEALLTNDSPALAVADAAEKAFAEGGAHAMLESMRREQQKFYDRGELSPYSLAETCALLHDKAGTLKYLQATYDQHDERVNLLDGNRMFDFLNDEPAFRQLRAELGLAKVQLAQKTELAH